MRYHPGSHHRRSIRLRAFDYRTPGCYVVTICTEQRRHLFGKIVDGQMVVSAAGQMVQQTWDELPWAYPDVDIDAAIVMPNHFHGIIILPPTEQDLSPTIPTQAGTNSVGATPCGCPGSPNESPESGTNLANTSSSNMAHIPDQAGGHQGQPQGVAPTGSASSTGIDVHGNGDLASSMGNGSGRLSLPEVVHRFKTLTTHRYGEGVQQAGWQPYPGRLWQRNYYERVVRNERELEKFRTYIEGNPGRWFEDPYRG